MAPEARPSRARRYSFDLIRLEEGLAQDIITPYLGPVDYLYSLKCIAERCSKWKEELPKNSKQIAQGQIQSNVESEQGRTLEEFTAGTWCTVVSPVTVREDEGFESIILDEFEAGTKVVILAQGVGRRVQVRKSESDITGWVSVKTKRGEPLLAKQ